MAEAFICEGLRTPIGRFGGALSSVRADDLLAHVISAVMEAAPGLPGDAVPGATVNRLCGSGLEAVGQAARAIRCGEAEVMIAGGVESMSRAPFVMGKAESAFSRKAEIFDTTIGWRFVNPKML